MKKDEEKNVSPTKEKKTKSRTLKIPTYRGWYRVMPCWEKDSRRQICILDDGRVLDCFTKKLYADKEIDELRKDLSKLGAKEFESAGELEEYTYLHPVITGDEEEDEKEMMRRLFTNKENFGYYSGFAGADFKVSKRNGERIIVSLDKIEHELKSCLKALTNTRKDVMKSFESLHKVNKEKFIPTPLFD